VAQIQRIVQERQVQILVPGLPYSMNGSLGFQAKQVQFAKDSPTRCAAFGYVDERRTSFEAEQLQAETVRPRAIKV